MRETLLVIDGRGQPDTLLRTLERAGFFCVYARGPLKAKAVLKEHPVALILWKDNTGNADLSRDLTRVWKAHPRIPVIHLYARDAQPSAPRTELSPPRSSARLPRPAEAESAEVGGQVRISLPVEAADAQLLPVIEQMLAGLKPPPASELNVLGAASRRQPSGEALADSPVSASHGADCASPKRSADALGDAGVGLSSHTGLSAAERESLYGGAEGGSGGRWAAGRRWIRRALSRIRPWLESGGA